MAGRSDFLYTGSGRVRPVITGQGVYEDQSGSMSARWIHDFLGDGDGGDHSATRTALGLGATAHPISYWIYGVGGAPYWDCSGDSDLATAFTDMAAAAQHSSYLQAMNRAAGIYGLAMITYEGGPQAPANSTGTTINMTARPASPNMTDLVEANQHNWWQSGGGLSVYFHLAGSTQWVFVDDDGAGGDIYGSPSPKMVAISEIKTMSPDAPTVSASTEQNATAIPGTAAGGAYALGYDDPSYAPAGSGSGTATLTASDNWQNEKGWIWVASSSASRTVSAVLSGGGTVICFVDGVRLGSSQTASGTVTFGTLTLGAGVHGVILTAASGQITVTSVQVS